MKKELVRMKNEIVKGELAFLDFCSGYCIIAVRKNFEPFDLRVLYIPDEYIPLELKSYCRHSISVEADQDGICYYFYSDERFLINMQLSFFESFSDLYDYIHSEPSSEDEIIYGTIEDVCDYDPTAESYSISTHIGVKIRDLDDHVFWDLLPKTIIIKNGFRISYIKPGRKIYMEKKISHIDIF